MAYSIQQYINAGLSFQELESRVKNLEPFIRVYMRDYENIRRSMEDPEYGKACLADLQAKLDDLKADATSLITVIELKKLGEC